ncbi:MAG: hypothetical protein EOM83_00300 [Clostridia bacterium]|nr:hypothetical protein [Clostridia bacterium]
MLPPHRLSSVRRDLETSNKQQTTNNKQQTTNNKQRTTNNKQRTTNNKQRPVLPNPKVLAGSNVSVFVLLMYGWVLGIVATKWRWIFWW